MPALSSASAGALSARLNWRLPVAILSVGFHLWLVLSGLLPNLIVRPIHMALALPFVLLPLRRGPMAFVDGLLLAAGLAGCAWVVFDHDKLLDQYGYLETPFQFVMSGILLLVALEAARRAIKWILPAVALIALAYGLWGHLIPGRMGYEGIPASSLLGTLVIAEGGLWGELTGISANIIAVFIMLGALIAAGEASEGFMSLSLRLAGRFRAGAAKVAVLASGFFGSVSGSASANVASTGAVTLPAMARLGYPPSFAAAVEATASTGGQIMPPLMGAGAFVMVELLGVPYGGILIAATLPALLFFWTSWAGVDHFAARLGMPGMAPDQLPAWRKVATTLPFFALPFIVLLVVLFTFGRTPQFAAAWALLAAAALLPFGTRGFVGIINTARRFEGAILDAAKQIAVIAAIVLCAGIIIGVLNQTGLGVKITGLIIRLSGGELWSALLLTGLACLILGMEVPTTAAYVISVAVAGPALQELGLPALHAHLFVFWYALLSTITPPVCGTVFIASGMAGADWLRTAVTAMRLGLGLYVVPLAFIRHPALLAPLDEPLLALLSFLLVGTGVWAIGAGLAWRFRQPALNVTALVVGPLMIFAIPT